jgi:hypothetical protein
LIPSITHRKENRLKDLLFTLTKYEIKISWNQIRSMQTMNLKNGINKVGFADLIIAQNAIENNLELYTLDKYFSTIGKLHGIRLYTP